MSAPTTHPAEADVDAVAGLLAEQHHLLNDDAPFARLATEHPDACHTAADYPEWTPGGAA